MGLRQGCLLSATLFGLSIDGLHSYLGAHAPGEGIQIQQLRLQELVYADDICSCLMEICLIRQIALIVYRHCWMLWLHVAV